MAISLTWSLLENGTPISSADFQSGAAGTLLDPIELYLRHNGDNPITGCKFFVGQKSGTYTGTFNATDDLAELLTWGDGLANGGPADDTGFGGLFLSQDTSAGNYTLTPFDTLPTRLIPGTVNDPIVAIHTGVGDSLANGINLQTSSGAGTAGEIQDGETDVHFKVGLKIPTDEGSPGIRQFDLKFGFSFTS